MEDKIKSVLEKDFGIKFPKGKFTFEGKYVFYFTGEKMLLQGTFGLHVGIMEEGGIRPTMDACQMATKGFVDVEEGDAKRWMCGLDLDKEAEGNFVILRWGKYILGPGKPRRGKILNNLPKNRRLPLNAMG